MLFVVPSSVFVVLVLVRCMYSVNIIWGGEEEGRGERGEGEGEVRGILSCSSCEMVSTLLVCLSCTSRCSSVRRSSFVDALNSSSDN